MSRAEPMDPEDRALNYTEIICRCGEVTGRRQMTPRQVVRYWHKSNRLEDDYIPVYVDGPAAERPKGRPTPRQRKPRRDG